MKKKIIWIAAECPFPPNSGGRLVTWNRLEILSKKFDVYLFCAVDSQEDFQYKKNLERICKSVLFYKREKNIVSVVKSLFYPFPAVTRWFKEMQFDVERTINKVDIKWIIVDFPQMLGNVPPKLFDKIILNQHNIEYKTLENIAQAFKNPIKRLFFKITAFQMKKYEEKIYKKGKIAYYTFVSLNEKTFFEKKYGCKNTLFLPIGSKCTKAKKNIFEKKIVFVGKMSYYPNEEAVKWFVAKIWPRVKEKEPSAKFVVVGRDPSENLMNFLQNAKDVFATGNVKSVDEFYDSAALVVVPIISGGGVNVKILEALGAGKIVVTTHKGIEGTDFIAGQHLFVENTAESFSDRVIDILQNSKKYDYISNNAFKYCCEHYSWSQTCKPMIDVMSN